MRRMLFALALVACGKPTEKPPASELTAGERMRLAALSPLPPVPGAATDSPAAIAFGQMLFFDEALGGPLLVDNARGKAGERGKLACRTCHAAPAMDDAPNHVSHGGRIGGRNTPPIVNAAFYRWSNWGGRFDSQWSLVLGAAENPEVMNGSRVDIARTVLAKYPAEYAALVGAPIASALADRARFPDGARPRDGGAWDAMAPADRELVDRIFVQVGKAIAAYMRTLVARDAPFDRFIAGDATAISASAQRGAQLFLVHCESCHGGPHFQDDAFHALGVAQFGADVPAVDLGRFADVPGLVASPFTGGVSVAHGDGQRGQFRTPTLRNVAVTAPYMHAGQFATLAAVVAFYNAGGGRVDAGVVKDARMKPLGLTPQQQADLVAFMETLTDTRVPAERLVDTSR